MTIAVVTGGNQGLGFASVRGLCRTLANSGIVYLGARDRARGEAAIRRLREEGLSPRLHVVDVTSSDEVEEFAHRIRAEHGGVDIVLSNAAARRTPARPDSEQVREFINTNNYGAHRMIRAFSPLLRDGARFIVVASAFGSLHYLPAPLREEFDTATKSLEELEHTLDHWVGLVEAGSAQQAGWPASINEVSKVGQVAAVRIMAREYAADAAARGILINAACPGLVDTEASRPWFTDMSEAQSPDDAAVDVIWLATLPSSATSPYGELVQHREVIPFDAAEWERKYGRS
jgi:carbonyl reductase 1